MHPALSVVLFTSLSGAGYGLLFLLGLGLLFAPNAFSRGDVVLLAAAGAGLASIGLLSSLLHLGQPQRAWRALSQWRSSWLSREGVAALFCYLPIVACAGLAWSSANPGLLRASGAMLALAAAITVWCTARIYTSLTPIPAWRHPLVLPGYLGLAAFTGLLWWALLRVAAGAEIEYWVVFTAGFSGAAMIWLKSSYWRAIDASPMPASLQSATGLCGAASMRPSEAPHTEANYLLREMGYVLARKHAARLRAIALTLLLIGVLSVLAAALAGPTLALLSLTLGAGAAQLGVLLERWLFFAQARHVVTVYYRG